MARGNKELKNRITYLLELYPHLRDSDRRLCSNIWVRELEEQGKDYKSITAEQMLVLYNQSKLTTQDSITRARRQIQEYNPNLRGEKYAERHAKVQEVKKDLGYS